jgi:hypothetical protein
MSHHIAQFNIAILQEPIEAPRFDAFRARIDAINALAETSPGFVWRLVGDGSDATGLRPLGDDILVNLSVWQSIEQLFAFTYKSAHSGLMARRREWFPNMAGHHMVLWWVAAGHLPDVHEAAARLTHLNQHGPTATAFTFKDRFDPPQWLAASKQSG